jgi:hypothetical protein
VLSDGVAGENCIVYHNGTANVFSNMERIYHSKLYKLEVLGRIRTQEVVSTENFDSIWRTKLFSIFGYEEVQDSQEPRFSMIS